ncbi:pyridoxamine 5'-phosphate oxidase [Lewinella cohaerens]|uniref:pyridoxamine 5'-phosphate oxidase n=1 Tax=Lewinella cohaerens TaxID=70995 RepID=UPI00036B9ED7|nr:pyridoxamine 5'-phosphate oxidase [Lewinella cohaerens]
MLLDLGDLREDYNKDELSIEDTYPSPFDQFKQWFAAAQQSEVREPNAMTLATIAANGRPKARIVLLKHVDDHGLLFYTNYDSQKGQDLVANPVASLVFFWDAQQRQVRVEGTVEKISEASSRDYFQSRPKGSQIGATASPQSQVISDREILRNKVIQLEEAYADQEKLPLPGNWGGFRLIPDCFEFWQGRSSRLHDRIRYRLVDGEWLRERLAP